MVTDELRAVYVTSRHTCDRCATDSEASVYVSALEHASAFRPANRLGTT